jgi:transcriptional regulator with XRE-family HTH domain
MIDVKEYLLLVMKKKGLSQAEVVRKLNIVEKEHGEKQSHLQNLNEYLRDGLPFRPKYLIKLEVALELPYGTLVNMVAPPLSKEGKKELDRWKKIYRG